MNQSMDGPSGNTDVDPREGINLGDIAALFNKWPGPTIMAVGTLLACAATGIRIGGVEISGREFAGFEFGAIFFGGIVLIVLGVAVLIVRERLLVADQERRLRQEHELGLELGRARTSAASQRVELLMRAAGEAGGQFPRGSGATVEQMVSDPDADVEQVMGVADGDADKRFMSGYESRL
ncbi:MAG: hypothetical protein WDZ46_02710 [Solirubrobacterales bacterium]